MPSDNYGRNIMKYIYSLVVFLLLIGCKDTSNQNQSNNQLLGKAEKVKQKPQDTSNQLGAASNPIKFYFTPSVSKKVIEKHAKDIVTFLKKETGYHFKVVVPENYEKLIEGFGSGSADVAIMNSFGYLLANKKYGARAKLRSLRYGKSTYQGQIIVNVASNINELEDLNGKTFAYTDHTSTSGHLFPKKLLIDKGISLADHKFVIGHDEVVKLVYEGKIDAGATFYSPPSSSGEIRDARARVIKKYPDVAEKVKVLTLTDPIPNDPVVFNKDMDENTVNKLVFAIMKYAITPHGKSILSELYGTEGFVRCSDLDYDLMKNVVQKSDVDLNDFL